MKRLVEITQQIENIRDQESIRLFRMARRAAAHGCSERMVTMIREEAWHLRRMAPDGLLNPFQRWEFAFRCGEVS